MITDGIKDFTVILGYLDSRVKQDLVERLSAFSRHIETCRNTNSTEHSDLNALFATKLFEFIYGHPYYFPEDRKEIQRSHVRDRHKMMIVVSGITDFAKASKEEREQILKQLTPVKEVSTFQKIINRFKRTR